MKIPLIKINKIIIVKSLGEIVKILKGKIDF
jgi:hypothetical protein